MDYVHIRCHKCSTSADMGPSKLRLPVSIPDLLRHPQQMRTSMKMGEM